MLWICKRFWICIWLAWMHVHVFEIIEPMWILKIIYRCTCMCAICCFAVYTLYYLMGIVLQFHRNWITNSLLWFYWSVQGRSHAQKKKNKRYSVCNKQTMKLHGLFLFRVFMMAFAPLTQFNYLYCFLPDLSKHLVSDYYDVKELMDKGNIQR